ncbi:parallel beta helix pectate lyase-like protein [Kribbella orskensis]|uniref:Parallel beta helix pectate lyase-like protein n=1 Tax=Kribbella orskensis TaxID=2512216 RepID=A0ABY2BHE9_9ACTN|nr:MULTISPECIES: right-handed parallel beta-helix repeat-containing protein [Kribbella]TCN38290.1 parallel beta helix pectate lyase-like protein [Kribbella sp. VKM Ac-2500]TCO20180.1 parallel beta helix pectate lyase-like protein [Kribbella orskensis]
MTKQWRRRRTAVSAGAGVVAMALVTVAAVNLGAQPAGAAKCESFWVAPNGDDAGKGTAEDPWRTVTQARDQIRAKKLNDSAKMGCDITVNLKAGDYPVSSTIQFDQRDSGANGHKVVYRSADGPGKATLSGAEEIKGWEPFKDGIYKAKVDPSKPFYTLFEDGKRATNARYPNRGSDDTWSPYLTSILFEEDKMDVHNWLWGKPGDWDPAWDMSQASVTIWSGGSWSWFTDTIPLLDTNFKKTQTTLKYWTRYAMVNSRGGSRYFFQNSLSFLDQPGEYFMDFKAGEVYYKPRGETMDGVKVLRPTVKTILDLAGSSAQDRLHDVSFDGLGLQYSDFVSWYRNGWVAGGDSGDEHRYPEYDRQIELPRNRFGAVRLTNTSNIDLTRLHLSDTGFTGIYLLFANDHVKISDSLLENIGADGIKVEGGWPGEGDLSNHHTISNNYISNIGELVPGDAAGIELMDTGDNTISNIVVRHSARYGISLESRPEVKDGDQYTDGNSFKYIRLEETGLDSGDMGSFYSYGVGNQEPHPIRNTVDQMVIGDVIPDPSMPDAGGTRGVHMDAGGCGYAFSNVQVGRVTDQKYQSYQCNQVTNADWVAGFDASKMEYDKIGVLPAFPYDVPKN